MIHHSRTFDQTTLERMIEEDKVVQRYRTFFSLINWEPVLQREAARSTRGQPHHPLMAYIKALLIKLIEGKEYITELRSYLVEHPLLVIELDFRQRPDPSQPYGFDVERTIPKRRWLTQIQRMLDHGLLQDLLAETIKALQNEIPGLGETIAVDVKHIYANKPRESIEDRFCKDRRPKGDPDCRVGVKSDSNQKKPDGTTKGKKEYLWGYGSGVVSALTADYGDVVLAEHTLPFNEGDVSYFLPLYHQTVATLGFFPTNVTADSAFDAWYVYQTCAHHGGIAAVPLNQHGHATVDRDTDGTPFCTKHLRMSPTCSFDHTNGYRARRYRCPLLHPEATGETCDHEQFKKGKGCVKDVNVEAGGIMRVTLDRISPLYKTVYTQRTSVERINSQAKAQGIERPKVHNGQSVKNLNTLIYVIINVRALRRAKSINKGLLRMI